MCDEKWVYYDNRQKRWVGPGQKAGTVAKRTLTNNKVRLSVWWDEDGIIFYDFLPIRQTINGEVYREYLDPVQQNLIIKRPCLVNRQRVIFHQDTAKPHTAILTKEQIMKELNWELIIYPPYSPDLAPSDYYLFLWLQNYLNNSKLINAEEVKTEVISFFESKSKKFFKEGIYKLVDRWAEVVA